MEWEPKSTANVFNAEISRILHPVKSKKVARILGIGILLSPVVITGAVVFNFYLIRYITSDSIYQYSDELIYHQFALVPGSGHYKPELWTNHTLLNRLSTAADLYRQQKVGKIIISGTYTNNEFSETGDMRELLITFGVSEKDILGDSLSLRTWDTMRHLKTMFGAKDVVVITQRRQLERALFIGKCIGIETDGLMAPPPPHGHIYHTVREYLARSKAVYDCLTYQLGIKNE